MLPFFGWLTGALFFFYAWVLRVTPSIMVDEIMREFSVGAAAVGNLSAVYFYGYAGFQIPVGMLIDRFGPRRLMTIAALICGASTLLAAWSPSIELLALSRFMIGASAAFSLSGAMAVAGQWFEPARFALLGGLAMAAGMAGGVVGQAPTRLVVEAWGWRPTVAMMSLGGLMIAVMAYTTIRDRRRGSGGLFAVLRGLRQVAANPQTTYLALAGLGTNGALLGFASLWGVPFMRVAHGLEPSTAAFITSLLIAGYGFGAPFFGWLSDRMQRRKPPFLIGYAICLPALLALIYAPPLPAAAVGVLTFLCGFGGAGQITGFALARELNPPHLSATAIGIVNAIVTGAGALYQPLIGIILDHIWNGAMSNGVRFYGAADYRFAFSVLVANCVVGLAVTFAVRESYCKPVGAASEEAALWT